MSFHPASPEPQTLADRRAHNAEYYLGILHGIIDRGADMVRIVHENAKAQSETAAPDSDHSVPAPKTDFTIQFDRIARAVRRSIVLARTLDAPVPAAPPAGNRATTRQRIIRGVEDMIQREVTGQEAETLHAELLERMDGPEFDEEIPENALPGLITEICRDLGLGAMPGTHPWKRRTPADLALLRARAVAPQGAMPRADGDEQPGPYSPGIRRP